MSLKHKNFVLFLLRFLQNWLFWLAKKSEILLNNYIFSAIVLSVLYMIQYHTHNFQL